MQKLGKLNSEFQNQLNAEAGEAVEAGEAEEAAAAWGGSWSSETAEDFAAAAVEMYTEQVYWEGCQKEGLALVGDLFGEEATLGVVKRAILDALGDLEDSRSLDFEGQMLWSSQLRATEYFSRWIELKESLIKKD